MCTEVMIISAAADFGSELGVALAQRGAYRVSLVQDGATALARVQQGLLLLDSLDEEAGRALVQQLRETKPGLAVHFTPQAAGVEAALEQLQPAEDTLDAAPLEPLAGDESDSSSWRFVREPEFLRGLAPATPAANPDIEEEESLQDEETQCLLAVSAEVSDDGKEETPPNDLMALAQVDGRRLRCADAGRPGGRVRWRAGRGDGGQHSCAGRKWRRQPGGRELVPRRFPRSAGELPALCRQCRRAAALPAGIG